MDPLLWLAHKAGLVPPVEPHAETMQKLAMLEALASDTNARLQAVERMLRASGALRGGPWDEPPEPRDHPRGGVP